MSVEPDKEQRRAIEALAQVLYEAEDPARIAWAKRSQIVREPWLLRARRQLQTPTWTFHRGSRSMKTKSRPNPLGDNAQQAEAAKTSRLRALRLAKEAADKEAAAIEAAAKPAKPAKRRVRAAPAADQPGSAWRRWPEIS
jgi:hypothetical protein